MSDQWNTYRTRFLVRAKQLDEAISFIDAFGREQQGRPGDYLVESCQGHFHIARQEIFEDVYVPMEQEPSPVFRPRSALPREHRIAGAESRV